MKIFVGGKFKLEDGNQKFEEANIEIGNLVYVGSNNLYFDYCNSQKTAMIGGCIQLLGMRHRRFY